MLKPSVLAGLAALCLCPSLFAQAPLQAQIRWTSSGIPHIQASSERGLGYGIGYAYARDNACLLANEIITARGERSRFFGREGQNSAQLGNLPSDFFFTWLNDAQALKTLWAAQPPALQQRLDGYARGFNAYLKVASRATTQCLGEAWLRPISSDDLLRLTRRLLVEGGAGQFAEALVSATPPGAAKTADTGAVTGDYLAQRDERFRLERGSNAVAVGSQRSATGNGMLLANPHFPWSGALRFYQLHLTIPGQLDVMGAALPGLPVVNIGFNQQLAWTHTVDTAAHFTLYRLQLDPKDSTRYLVDGQSLALKKTILTVQVREADGQLGSVSHDLYESRLGPLLRLPGMLEWTASEAFALRDANLENSRVLQQWYAINQAKDVTALRASVETLQGIPWVNTLATDASGQALYMDQSVVPYLRPQQLAECVIPQLAEQGLPGLQGNRSACAWTVDASTAQPGITPANQLPVLLRNDVVQNSNDSAWLTNPASPLQGFSPLVSRERPLSPRAQFALSRLQGSAPISAGFLRAMVTDNHVFLADRLLPDLLKLCASYSVDAGIKPACTALAGWDRSANRDATLGMLYFQAFFRAFSEIDGAWRQPFNPQQPLTTPTGLALDNPTIAEQLRLALVEASTAVAKSGVPAKASWGDVQWLQRGDQRIAIPGGDGHLGVYNAMQSEQRADHLEVLSGSSYIQLVTFTAKGPQAHGLLAFSQSTEPGSRHYADQTQLFSQQQWPVLPFSEAEIAADGVIETLNLKE